MIPTFLYNIKVLATSTFSGYQFLFIEPVCVAFAIFLNRYGNNNKANS